MNDCIGEKGEKHHIVLERARMHNGTLVWMLEWGLMQDSERICRQIMSMMLLSPIIEAGCMSMCM